MDKMNKKGIMVQFLTVTLLAIIIFAPACYVASSFFRLSDQAKDNFIKFVDKVKEIETEGPLAEKVALLIMDEGTALVYFEPYQREVEIKVDSSTSPGSVDFILNIQKGNGCLEEKGCFCLFREPKFELVDSSLALNEWTVTDVRQFCQEFEVPLKMDCNTGVPSYLTSYTCSNGFIAERNLAKGDPIAPDSHYEVGRRTQIKLTKEANYILLEG